jgi:coenzyme Q-binding protein COQ10
MAQRKIHLNAPRIVGGSSTEAKMVTYRETCLVGAPPQEVFNLVADVEHYPEFLPMWQQATVSNRTRETYETLQTVGVGWCCRRFQTCTRLDPPRQITVSSNDGLFRAFNLNWGFSPTPEGGCRIDFSLDCEVAALLLQPTLELMMQATARSMVAAFVSRANALAVAK